MLLRVADGRHEEAGDAGADGDQPEQDEHQRRRWSARPARHRPPSATAIDPKTSANRKPTTRPISADGVRSWNSAWLGMTKTMFAMPSPNAEPEDDPEVARSGRSRTVNEPGRDVAGADHPALGEARADEADDEPTDQVADADARLDEGSRPRSRSKPLSPKTTKA